MPDVSAPEMSPINFAGISRIADRLKWKADEVIRPDPSTPITSEPQKLNPSPLIQKEAYDQAKDRLSKAEEKEMSETGTYLSKIGTRNLEEQKAMLSPKHELYAVINRISSRIGEAEKKLQERGSLSRTELTGDYQTCITLNNEINAHTYRHSEKAFIEGGLITVFDNFLREVKHQHGITEDHIAGVLAHEVSHTDQEAEGNYLNEEYCDTQGVVLSAEAGYNPRAMVDFEDFLIYLEKGDEYYKEIEEASKEKEKKQAFSFTHPPSENRRLVIINLLNSSEGSIPNQTRDYVPIDENAVSDLRDKMKAWVETRENRVLSFTRDDCLQEIDKATNLTEVVEAMVGYKLFRKAEITKAIADNPDFEQISVLYEALTTELREASISPHGYISVGGGPFSEDIDHYSDKEDNELGKSQIIIGGLANQLKTSSESQTVNETEKAVNDLVNDVCNKISLNYDVYDRSVHYKRGESDESHQKRTQELRQKDKIQESIINTQIRDLYKLLFPLKKTVDLPGLLTGDFSSCPELKDKLKQLGISRFDNYLKKIQTTYQNSDVNYHLREIAGEKTLKVLPDKNILSIPVSEMTREDVYKLLETTRGYRATYVMNARLSNIGRKNFSEDAFGQTYSQQVRQKIESLIESYSTTPEEQGLLKKLITKTLDNYGKGGFFYKSDSDHTNESEWLMRQLIRSEQYIATNKYGLTENITVPFTSGLSQDFFNLRLAPLYGDKLLDQYISGIGDESENYQIEIMSKFLGREFDTVRVYLHEGEEQTKKDIAKQIRLADKRRQTIPVYGTEAIPKDHIEEELAKINDKDSQPEERWNTLKTIAEHTSYETKSLEKIILCRGISHEEKIAYLNGLISEGKTSLEQTFKAVTIGGLYDLAQFTSSQIEDLQISYEIGMKMLKTLPLSPSYQDLDLTKICNQLFDTKVTNFFISINKAKYTSDLISGGTLYIDKAFYRYNHSLEYLFPEFVSQPEELAKRELDFVFEFVKEGGTVDLSTVHDIFSVSGMNNEGAKIYLLDLVKDANYPIADIERRVNEILELHKERYGPLEIDKWKSLIAYVRQPNLYTNKEEMIKKAADFMVWHEEKPPAELKSVRLGDSDKFVEYDLFNLDHQLKIYEEILKLPPSSYRDYCLGLYMDPSVYNYLQSYNTYSPESLTNLQGQKNIYHPGKAYFDKRMVTIAATAFSDISEKRFFDPRPISKKKVVKRSYIPRSERFAHDPISGFYIDDSEATDVWASFIKSSEIEHINTPFSYRYREIISKQGVKGMAAEEQIFTERIQLISLMRSGPLKEALTLYTIRSTQDRLNDFSPAERQTLEAKVQQEFEELTKTTTSLQGKKEIFDIILRKEINITEGKISPDDLKKRFPKQEELIVFITQRLPEKSAQRDSYLLQAIDSYPLRIGDASKMRSLLFEGDYSTKEEQTTVQRAGLEFIRSVKLNEDVKESDIKDLILWIIDEKRQVKSIDDFIIKIAQDKLGEKLLLNYVKSATGGLINSEPKEKIFLALPLSVKRFLIKKHFQTSGAKEELNSLLKRSGMLPERVNNIFSSEESFNSLLEGTDSENPLKKEMFFDLVLGEKGILEKPVVTEYNDFEKRLKEGFEGSQMHVFIDDILEIAFRQGKWDKSTIETARVVVHSFIEAAEPVRRATVLFNFLTEIPKIDFNDPDKNKVQSRFLQVALSSIGVLGAKLGQIDELIPKGWGSEMASLKHATKPMSKLTVADIFTQEKLSPDYIIENAAGAASTACGYVVKTPTGEAQFAKILRPEVKIDWLADFFTVRHMLDCLKKTGHLQIETNPVMDQIEKLVKEELQTQRETENVVRYIQAETLSKQKETKGIRPVEMPKDRYLTGNEIKKGQPAESLVIFEELLPKSEYIELSKLIGPDLSKPDGQALIKLRDSLNMDSLYSTIVQDFLYRSLVLGSWHSDLHDGNILISRDGKQTINRIVESDDLVLIDFGQTGVAETEEKRHNTARFLTGLALSDRSMVAQAIHDSLESPETIENIEKELGINPFKLQEKVTAYMAQHKTDEYLSNFMKASINVIPYLKKLPLKDQFELISPYIGESERKRGWIKIKEAFATKNFTRLL